MPMQRPKETLRYVEINDGNEYRREQQRHQRAGENLHPERNIDRGADRGPDRGHSGHDLGSDLPEEVRHAILAHCDKAGRDTEMDRAIYAADPVTGLIVASVLMHPSKKLAETDAEFVGKRFKEKRFAAGANREAIASCSELGLDLHEFLEISLVAMRSISKELGL